MGSNTLVAAIYVSYSPKRQYLNDAEVLNQDPQGLKRRFLCKPPGQIYSYFAEF